MLGVKFSDKNFLTNATSGKRISKTRFDNSYRFYVIEIVSSLVVASIYVSNEGDDNKNFIIVNRERSTLPPPISRGAA